jgi:hypothetical protein
VPKAFLRATAASAAVALLASGCGFSPLSHHISVGDEAFVIFVGEGIDQHTDLFAVAGGGGSVFQVTFTPLIEQHPRLTPTGTIVAFLRMRDTLPGTRRDVVLMDLATGGDQVLTLPPGSGRALDLAWNRAGTTLYVRTDRGTWQSPAPPSPSSFIPVTAGALAAADSSLDLWLGQPRFARVIGCAAGGLCIMGPKGDTTALAPAGTDPMRWGDDSAAWFENSALVVRSLGPGRLRRIIWQNPPQHPRDASYAAGATPHEP